MTPMGMPLDPSPAQMREMGESTLTYLIEFGAHLSGSGAVWFDGAELAVLPPAVSSASTRQ